MIGGKENDKLFAQQQEKERQAKERPLNRLVMCDCLNHCGDDPDIAKGKARPCRSKIKWDEVHQRKSQAINVCMAIYQDQPQGIIGSEQVHRAWEIGKRLTELLGT